MKIVVATVVQVPDEAVAQRLLYLYQTAMFPWLNVPDILNGKACNDTIIEDIPEGQVTTLTSVHFSKEDS